MVKEVWESFKDAIWALLSPIIILGGIYSGYFTPTEAAVVSVVYSTIVGRYVYKELDNEAPVSYTHLVGLDYVFQ